MNKRQTPYLLPPPPPAAPRPAARIRPPPVRRIGEACRVPLLDLRLQQPRIGGTRLRDCPRKGPSGTGRERRSDLLPPVPPERPDPARPDRPPGERSDGGGGVQFVHG